MNEPPQKLSENTFIHRNVDTNGNKHDTRRHFTCAIETKICSFFHLFQFLQLALNEQTNATIACKYVNFPWYFFVQDTQIDERIPRLRDSSSATMRKLIGISRVLPDIFSDGTLFAQKNKKKATNKRKAGARPHNGKALLISAQLAVHRLIAQVLMTTTAYLVFVSLSNRQYFQQFARIACDLFKFTLL